MTIYDDMRGYIHTHDRNGWFDVIAETTPMYQMIDKADAENTKLRELVRDMWRDGMCECDERGACEACEYGYLDRMRELGIEVTDD